MYWFRRPPYLRWAAASLLVIGALVLELRGPATVTHPFVRRDLAPGTVLADEHLEWRPVPAGLLPRVDPVGTVLARPVGAGEPLVPSLVAVEAAPAVPQGWWALTVPLPAPAPPGSTVELVVVPVDPGGDPMVVPGVVLETERNDDPFLPSATRGLVAVPGEAASTVAAAAVEGRVVVGLAGG